MPQVANNKSPFDIFEREDCKLLPDFDIPILKIPLEELGLFPASESVCPSTAISTADQQVRTRNVTIPSQSNTEIPSSLPMLSYRERMFS